MKSIHQSLEDRFEEAKAYISYCVKEGAMDESEALENEEKMDMSEYVKWSEELMDKGDSYAESVEHGD